MILFVSVSQFYAKNAQVPQKHIYDATSYLHKDSLNKYIFPPISLLYEDMLFPKGVDNIDFDYLKKYAHTLPRSKIPYILDIESWDVRPNVFDFIAKGRIDKYIAVIKTLKDARPDLKFGYYGLLPTRDYVTPNPSEHQLKKWHDANKRLQRLARHVDVICPDLYTFLYKDTKYWKFYANKAIKEARMYHKPILPFVWPEYSDEAHLGTDIDASFWNFQLNFLYTATDGIIIWGGRDITTHPHTSKKWGNKAPWWIVTKKTILKKKK